MQALGLLLGPLVGHFDGTAQPARWQISPFDLGDADEQELARLGRPGPVVVT